MAAVDSWTGFYEVVYSRRSVRSYRPEAVAGEVVERLLAAAVWAPSAHNRQPWRFVVLTDSAEKKALALAMGNRLAADRSADGDDAALIEADVSRSYTRMTKAPVVIAVFLTMEDMDDYPDARRASAEQIMAVQGVAMAIQNLLLAATEEGLGACWMCAPLFCQDVVASTLSAPDHWQAQALITLGYPANRGKPPMRRPVGAIVKSRPA